MTRRRLLKTLFCSSVAMELNLSAAPAPPPAARGALDFIALGDFGSGDASQKALAASLVDYAKSLARKPDGLLLLGDNFYHAMPGGVKSPRWKSGFSDLYPSSVFPGPCWAILGNHDYHDTVGNEKAQLEYAASLTRKTRWTMPGKFYRVDFPAINPEVTFLMIDTNWKPVNQPLHKDNVHCWMKPAEKEAELAWLEEQLQSKRAPFTVVVGHHPLYSDGSHGDTPPLIKHLGPMFEKYGVHLYLCGHDHDLQHLELNGLKTSFVISGGGGAAIRPKNEAREGGMIKAVHGFTHLTLIDKRLHVRHINKAGKIVHGFSKGVDHDWRIFV